MSKSLCACWLAALSLLVAGTSLHAAAPDDGTGGGTPPATATAATADPNGNAAQGNAASPLSFKIGDFNFTPGGFIDFTTVWRSTDVGSGIGTNFAAIPYNNTVAGRISEFRESAQNSRVSLRADGDHDGIGLTGYLEADFLGNQPTNIAVTSNSATLRMRVYFADVRKGEWEVVAGQDWSLLTPGKSGVSPYPSDVFYSQAMDTNYLAGLVWSRDPQFRLIFHPSSQWAWGLSLENAEQYIGGSSGAPTVTLPATPNISGELDSGGTNFSDPAFGPDIITKLAFDSKPGGHGVHLEIAGLESTFRIYNPTADVTTKKVGGGGSVNLNAEVASGLHLIVNTYISDGGGRYLYGMAPDLMVRNNLMPSPIHADSGIGGFEFQANPQWMIYGYYSGIYVGKDVDYSGATPIGYGYSSAFNRSVQEGTFGVTHTFFKSANYGALQLITQASYLSRNPWATANPRDAHLGMGYVDLRYVLP